MLNLSANAIKVLEKRYLKRDEKGRLLESPDELFKRVANAVAKAEILFGADKKKTNFWKDRFLEAMISLRFLPNSPCLMNAGTQLGQLAACFVLPIEDSMESIFQALKEAALIHKSGGGTGFSFSKLRPKGDMVKSTAGVSSGPVSFIKVFDAATEEIKQGGKRRGANMATLNVNHPDIVEFIRAKEKPGTLPNFNLSVAVSDAFMEACEASREINLINPRNNKVVGKIEAAYLLRLSCEMAWKGGDPGFVFIDTVNRYNPTPMAGMIESTNPCGEQPLLPYESCVLGSINLAAILNNDSIDWELLKDTTKVAVRFLDNVIEINKYPFSAIKEHTMITRKIGLGIMGFADMLIKLGVPYTSDEAVKIAKEIMSFIQYNSKQASIELSKERGAFPAYKESVYTTEDLTTYLNIEEAPQLAWDELIAQIKKDGIRNATTTTIAPTGSISIIAEVSSGIEPIFAVAYKRKMLDEEVEYIHPLLRRYLSNVNKETWNEIIKKGKLSKIQGIDEKIKKLFLTTYEISPEMHVKMQAAFQLFTDNAVSKTVNLPAETTVDDIKKVYLEAYRQGCKGITVFRDKSKEQVIIPGIIEEEKKPRARPKVTRGTTWKMNTGCGNLYVTINEDEYGLCEVFSQMGKTGGCAASQLEAISRLISLALRSGIEIEAILKQLRGIRCPFPSWDEGEQILSCADAIAKAIMRYLSQRQGIRFLPSDLEGMVGICPECGGVLRHLEGCIVCEVCGHSRC